MAAFLSSFADQTISYTSTAFPYRECEGVKYNVTKSVLWTSIPPRDTYNEGFDNITYWTAKVIAVNTNAIYVQVTGRKSNHSEAEDDWSGRKVVIINHPRQALFANGETLTPEFFHLIRTTNGVQVYDYGKPYNPQTNKVVKIESAK